MRKGSLSLSVNAIVVLVLAITMLGMGLAFTKGKFSELGSKIEVPEPDYPATQDDPIVLAVNEMKFQTEKSATFSANFYNEGATGWFYPCMQCGTEYSSDGTSVRAPIQILSGEYETFKVLLKKTGDAAGTDFPDDGTNICQLSFIRTATVNPTQVQMTCDNTVMTGTNVMASRQIVIKVQ